MSEIEPLEQNLTSAPPAKSGLTLQQAIEFGEYDPKYLANFAEWHNLSVHVQWQLVRKALNNRHSQLITQYAELNNALDLRLKPDVQEAMKNVEKQLKIFEKDREELYVEYSQKL